MLREKTLLPEISIHRTWPKNIIENHKYLFKDEIIKFIPEVKIDEISPCLYSFSGLFKENILKTIHPFSYQNKISFINNVKNEIKFNIFEYKHKYIHGKTVAITDNFSNGYFHWFSDVLPRLFVLQSQNINFDRLILPSFCLQEKYINESLLPFNISHIEQLEPHTRVQLDTLIALSPIAPTGNYRPEIMKGLQFLYRNYFNINHSKGSFKKIYISRSKAPKRKVINEDEILFIFDKFGYQPIIMENLSFIEQINIIGNADRLVSLHGAGLTNMLFMPETSKVLEFRFPGDKHNNCYFSLSNALGFDYYYYIGSSDKKYIDPHKDNIYIDPIKLKNILEIIDK